MFRCNGWCTLIFEQFNDHDDDSGISFSPSDSGSIISFKWFVFSFFTTAFIYIWQFPFIQRWSAIWISFCCYNFLPIFHHFSFNVNDNRYYFQSNDLAYFSMHLSYVYIFFFTSPLCYCKLLFQCQFHFHSSLHAIHKNTKKTVDSFAFFNRSIIHFGCMIFDHARLNYYYMQCLNKFIDCFYSYASLWQWTVNIDAEKPQNCSCERKWIIITTKELSQSAQAVNEWTGEKKNVCMESVTSWSTINILNL